LSASFEPPPLPPLSAEPPLAADPPPPTPWLKRYWVAIVGALIALVKLKPWLWLVSLLKTAKLAKLLPFLKTGGSMVATTWVYALGFGWSFAVGFVLCLFVHELGHVVAARSRGVPFSTPLFIPFVGAFILLKKAPQTKWDQAIIGIGGPLGGLASVIACAALHAATGNALFLALAATAALLNLFNLIPIYPLDGGQVVAAISPWLWLAGTALGIAAALAGWIPNPFVIVLFLLGLPGLWHALRRRGRAGDGDGEPRPMSAGERVGMGLAYLGLLGVLAWCQALAVAALERGATLGS
jgi:Zn-dependent protease